MDFQLSWTNSVQFAGSYIAAKNGYYKGYGLDVTLTPGGPNAPADTPVISKQALMSISAADYTARDVAKAKGPVLS